jgi:hypothetical protein
MSSSFSNILASVTFWVKYIISALGFIFRSVSTGTCFFGLKLCFIKINVTFYAATNCVNGKGIFSLEYT